MRPTHRFEVKIPIPLTKVSKIMTWLNSHPLMFSTCHPERHVNSLYLDNAHLARYEENLSGISRRKKVRIRWYHDIDDASKAKLEFKHRIAGKGFKVSFDTSLALDNVKNAWHKQLHNCYQNLPQHGQTLWLNEHEPILICRYRRQYFESRCQKIRATFDHNIHVYDQRYGRHINLTKQRSLGDYVLLELKADENYEAILSTLIGTCPLRPSRHSKYVNGIRNLMWY